jgi:hypothetical protein
MPDGGGAHLSALLSPLPSLSLSSPLTPPLTAAAPHASPTPAPAAPLQLRRPSPCTSRHPPWPRRRYCGRMRGSLRPPPPPQSAHGGEGGAVGRWRGRRGRHGAGGTAGGGSCRHHGRWSSWRRPPEVRHHRGRRSPMRDLTRGRRSRRPRARPRTAGPELCSSAGAPLCATGARGAAAAAGLTHGVELARP